MMVFPVCVCVCLSVDKFEKLSYSEFLMCQHEFNMVDYLYPKVQILKISEVKGQGHWSQIVDFFFSLTQ